MTKTYSDIQPVHRAVNALLEEIRSKIVQNNLLEENESVKQTTTFDARSYLKDLADVQFKLNDAMLRISVDHKIN